MGTVGYNRNSVTSSNRRKSTTTFIYNKPNTAERPMTAVSGAGYTSNKRSPAGSSMFDPLNQAKSHSPFQFKDENNIEVKLKELELKVNKLLEESILASARGEIRVALEKAKDAVAKERFLCKQKEQNSNNISIPVNIDLTFAVVFNLAIQFTKNEMYADAINTYQSLLKSRSFTNTGELKPVG
jgi:intraflagellar transport protein 88 homolog